MRDAKPLLQHYLNDDDYIVLSKAVASAYRACDQLMKDNPVFSFLTGQMMRGRLITPFVEYALQNTNILYHSFEPNSVRNWYQTRFTINGLSMTAHFLGAGKHRRSMAKQAACRAEIASRTSDLFGFEGVNHMPDVRSYCHLLHEGRSELESLAIAVPYPDQSDYYAISALSIVEADSKKVEEITESFDIDLLITDLGQESSNG